MGNKYAVLIGVEESADLTPCLYAADELRTLSAGLETAGVPNGRQTVLLGPTATKATVESRFRKLNKSLTAEDDIWFVFAGPAFSEKGRGYLACADTLADDPEETALAIADGMPKKLPTLQLLSITEHRVHKQWASMTRDLERLQTASFHLASRSYSGRAASAMGLSESSRSSKRASGRGEAKGISMIILMRPGFAPSTMTRLLR